MPWVVETLNCQPHLKSKVHSELLIQCQMRRVRRKFWLIKHCKPCIWGSLHVKRFSPLAKSALQAPCRKLIVRERIELVLNVTLCSSRYTLTALACNREFMTEPLTGANGLRT
jgi:hypothetical protein